MFAPVVLKALKTLAACAQERCTSAGDVVKNGLLLCREPFHRFHQIGNQIGAALEYHVHLRPGDWYRRRLCRGFRHLGWGVYLRRPLRPILWELERPWS